MNRLLASFNKKALSPDRAMGVIRPRTAACMLLGVASLMATGCRVKDNDRLTIGRDILPEAFGGMADVPPPSEIEPGGLREAAAFDRSGWQPTRYQVPLDRTTHQTTYARPKSIVNKTARQRGEWPTLETAMDTGEGSERQQAGEILIVPFYAAGDLIMAPFQAVFQKRNRPLALKSSPGMPYNRSGIAQPPTCDELYAKKAAPTPPAFTVEPEVPATPAAPVKDEGEAPEIKP